MSLTTERMGHSFHRCLDKCGESSSVKGPRTVVCAWFSMETPQCVSPGSKSREGKLRTGEGPGAGKERAVTQQICTGPFQELRWCRGGSQLLTQGAQSPAQGSKGDHFVKLQEDSPRGDSQESGCVAGPGPGKVECPQVSPEMGSVPL